MLYVSERNSEAWENFIKNSLWYLQSFNIFIIIPIFFFYHNAYFLVQVLATHSYSFLLLSYCFAISGTNGSFEFGSLNSSITSFIICSIVYAGDQLDPYPQHKQWPIEMDPLSLIFGWYILVLKVTFGGLNGYSAGKSNWTLKAALLYGGCCCNRET